MISKHVLAEMLTKPLLSGAVAGLLTRYVTYRTNDYGQPFTISINTMFPVLSRFNDARISLALMTAVSVGVASLTSDLIGDRLFAFLTKDEMMQNAGSGLFQLAAVSTGTSFLHYTLNNKSIGSRGILNIIGMSVASEAISTYLYNGFIRPMIRDSEEEDSL